MKNIIEMLDNSEKEMALLRLEYAAMKKSFEGLDSDSNSDMNLNKTLSGDVNMFYNGKKIDLNNKSANMISTYLDNLSAIVQTAKDLNDGNKFALENPLIKEMIIRKFGEKNYLKMSYLYNLFLEGSNIPK